MEIKEPWEVDFNRAMAFCDSLKRGKGSAAISDCIIYREMLIYLHNILADSEKILKAVEELKSLSKKGDEDADSD